MVRLLTREWGWSEVAATLKVALDAGYPDPVLVYARPIHVPPPADTPTPADEKQLFELGRIGVGPCASLGEAQLRDLPPSEWAAGLVEESMRWCDRAVSERDPLVLWSLRFPFWEAVRTHPRYQEIVREVFG